MVFDRNFIHDMRIITYTGLETVQKRKKTVITSFSSSKTTAGRIECHPRDDSEVHLVRVGANR